MTEQYMGLLEFIRPYPYMPFDKIHAQSFAGAAPKSSRKLLANAVNRGFLKKMTIRICRETIEVYVDVWAITEFGKEWLARQVNNGHASATAKQWKEASVDQESVTE